MAQKSYLNNIAIIELEILLFGQNYIISNMINTMNLQNINIVAAFSQKYMKANILSELMCQILHTRNSGASVSDEEAERV